jgi:hypothetical protein
VAKKKQTGELEMLSTQARAHFALHLRRLGLQDEREYRAWCRGHGFSARLAKTGPQRSKEVEHRNQEAVEGAFARSRTARKDPGRMLDLVFAGDIDRSELAAEYRLVAQLVSSFGRRHRSESIARFRELFLLAKERTKLISTENVIPDYARNAHNTYIGALAAVATHWASWQRPLEEWKVESKNSRRQFASLVRHLFAEYDIPAFFDSVWFKRTRTQNWFLHVAQGKSIRKAQRLFFPITQREAHELMQAPGSYTLEQALRWGQIAALGGSERMVDAVCGTRLADRFENDEFWISVLRFFVRNPFLDTSHYGPIVDFIQHQKYETQEVFVEPGVVERQPPPHPGFTMRGRTADGLMRQVAAWHDQLGRELRAGPAQWATSGIGSLSLIEGRSDSRTKRRWTVSELLNRESLVAEGRAMRHCVATYAHSCSTGRCSIWSLRCDAGEGPERMITIDVRPSTRMIVEARAKFNAKPSPQAFRILRRWAEREALGIASHVENWVSA